MPLIDFRIMDSKTVIIIGAGPIGIDMALTLVRRKDINLDVIVIERGPDVGSFITEHWGHVTLFSPHSLNASQIGLEALAEMNCEPLGPLDPERFSSGEEFVDYYVKPVASYLTDVSVKCKLMFNTTVVAAGRKNLSKGHLPRAPGKFEVLVEANGSEDYLECDYLVDCSGTIGTPNFIGKGGMPAAGERQLRAQNKINYYIPTETPPLSSSEEASEQFQGQNIVQIPWKKHVVVIGAGTSAISSINKCMSCTVQEHQVTWVTRTAPGTPPFTRYKHDPLPQRDALFVQGNLLAAEDEESKGHQDSDGGVIYRGFTDVLRVEELNPLTSASADAFKFRVTVQRRAAEGESPGAPEVVDCHEIVANTGYRPNMTMLSELQVHYCYASDAPMKLAAALLASAAAGVSGDCLKQVVPGKETLLSPEPRLYIIGIKSYGRGNAFLLQVGYEQVQLVAQLIAEQEASENSTAEETREEETKGYY